MKKSEKIFTVQNLAEKIKQAKALILSDYSGLGVDRINELRREIKKAGGEFEVVKNTLLQLATKDGKWEMGDKKLTGPTAALWLYTENITPLKTLNEFIRKNEAPKIKFGFWNDEQISIEKINQLANLPGMEELRAKLIGVLQSPIYGLANALRWNPTKLVYILKAKGGEKNG